MNKVINLDEVALYTRSGILEIDRKFIEFLSNRNFSNTHGIKSAEVVNSDVLIDLAILLEDFLTELFDIKEKNRELQTSHLSFELIHRARREFVQRHVVKKFSLDEQKRIAQEVRGLQILQQLNLVDSVDIDDLEYSLAQLMMRALHEESSLLEEYSLWAIHNKEGRKLHEEGSLFFLPQKTDYQNLIGEIEIRNRKGFNLTDSGMELSKVQAHANYCIFCHKQNKDSCRKGLDKLNELGIELKGCPLGEKISEMNFLKSKGYSIAALAMAVIDNPMIAGTGHRICNDCMNSCIYQKQEPVDIPQIETRILKDVLALPYGFEIYSLLTRWNPLNQKQRLPKKPSGKKILVCGLGPAGYTLSHYLLNDGHEVVAIDGLKIEPIDSSISGIDMLGNRQEFELIKDISKIYEPLSSRVIYGFGGVAEYGITARFDKNFLKVIRLLLERRSGFKMFGGIRFGSSITEKIAFEDYAFDHIALCLGAGRPNLVNFKNNFAKGVRLASDFLMSLQLNGAFRHDLLTNLQIRMPAIVIGGGLTAIDTACELKSYYVEQIKKFASRVQEIGYQNLVTKLNQEEKSIAEEFLSHANLLDKGIKDFLDVKVLYRKKMQDSPAYRLNANELKKAFEEGIEFVEFSAPKEAIIDEFGAVKELLCDDERVFKCKSLIVAAGTSPNVSIVREDRLDLPLDGIYLRALEGFKHIIKFDFSTGKGISFFGDLHPVYEGNVVKAMASAKNGYEEISSTLVKLKNKEPIRDVANDFVARIHKINRLSPYIVEILVYAPLIAIRTKPGHIFRLQNYHSFAKKENDYLLAMEGIAVTALSVDQDKSIISAIIVETGGSTSLIKRFQEGEPCIFMGPSGEPTHIPSNQTVLLVGGGRGNQPLTAIAELLTKNGCIVYFFAGYRLNSFVVNEGRMKKSCSKLIISIEDEDPKSGFFKGSVIEAIKNFFAKNRLKIDCIFTIGNNYLLHEVAKLKAMQVITDFAKAELSLSSLNSPMQCMMKGVCAQCLQRRIIDGREEFFYACANQDQNSDTLDFEHLHLRCQQNSLLEKVTNEIISQFKVRNENS